MDRRQEVEQARIGDALPALVGPVDLDPGAPQLTPGDPLVLSHPVPTPVHRQGEQPQNACSHERCLAIDPRSGPETEERAYEEAAAGAIAALPPCEAYCHTLTDPSILGEELRVAGAHTLTVFGLHMPARLFRADPDRARADALEATMRSLDSVLGEPLEECLLCAADGKPCLEVHTPLDLERELRMPGGHIFHRDLAWPFAERDEEVGMWGVETTHPAILLCGAGARRGGGVSGIPGRNAAMAALGEDARH